MSCDCDCCIEVPTPQSIYDEGEGSYPAETDIFDEIFDDSGLDNKEIMASSLWATYRYYMIGSCNIDTWVQAMKDRTAIIGPKWDAIFSKLSDENVDLSDLHELIYDRVIRHEPIEGTDGDVRTISHEGDNKTLVEAESLPQTATQPVRYLDRRDTTTVTPGVTDTDAFVPNTKDSEHYSEERDIMAVTFTKLIRNYPDVLDLFASEYRDYFIQRW